MGKRTSVPFGLFLVLFLFIPALECMLPVELLAQKTPQSHPVVLELFTSEGCSSCPPADRLLSRLVDPALGSSNRRKPLIALAFHVDYWNRLGWRDPFSGHRWTLRQEGYARTVANGNVYTPQLIVQGTTDCVGSDARCIERAIRAARSKPSPLNLRITSCATRPDGKLKLSLELSHARSLPPGARVLVALFENGIVTRVGAGENSGRTLRHDFVVRSLSEVQTLTSGSSANGVSSRTVNMSLSLDLPPHSDPRHWGVAALVQRPAGPILAADAV
ncbi:MAG TPA: DUF1223 domain-containing protein, partial [Thermoanaerobaculia bacterium]|nr:DUF1223 domain-containing protein [Thermoanaerobaculia bacterium]